MKEKSQAGPTILAALMFLVGVLLWLAAMISEMRQ